MRSVRQLKEETEETTSKAELRGRERESERIKIKQVHLHTVQLKTFCVYSVYHYFTFSQVLNILRSYYYKTLKKLYTP